MEGRSNSSNVKLTLKKAHWLLHNSMMCLSRLIRLVSIQIMLGQRLNLIMKVSNNRLTINITIVLRFILMKTIFLKEMIKQQRMKKDSH